MIVTVIGYRATGKSTVAKELASLLNWPWHDSDDWIEQQTGSTIAGLFATVGEAGFRQCEEQVIGMLTEFSNVVLSIGGGAVLSDQTCERVRSAGPVVWLRAHPRTILARMALDLDNPTRRPNLTALNSDEEVCLKLSERTPRYAALADLVIETDDRPASEIARQIYLYIVPQMDDWQRDP